MTEPGRERGQKGDKRDTVPGIPRVDERELRRECLLDLVCPQIRETLSPEWQAAQAGSLVVELPRREDLERLLARELREHGTSEVGG